MTMKPTVFDWIITLTILVLLTAGLVHCTTVRSPKALPPVQYYANPNAYMYAAVVDGAVFRDGRRILTNVRFQPFNTFALYTENVLFCGDQSEAFAGMTGPLVVTYKRVAHESSGRIGCHELVSIDRVQPKEGF